MEYIELSVSEYSQKMGVSQQSTYQKIKRGSLKTINKGNKTYIQVKEEDLNNIQQPQKKEDNQEYKEEEKEKNLM